jgi:hypothetical protein
MMKIEVKRKVTIAAMANGDYFVWFSPFAV